MGHRLLLQNARVIDGVSNEAISGVDVLVENDRFIEVSRHSLSADADIVLDLTGKTLLPGLFDCHVHLAWDGKKDVGEQSGYDSRELGAIKATVNMRKYLETGVTTVRDLGVHWLGLEARDAARNGVVPGPRVLASGPPVTTTGGHCWWCGIEADGEVDLRKTARYLAKRGVDLVKVIATSQPGGSSAFPSSTKTIQTAFTFDEMAALVDECHNLGLKVTAHVGTPDGIDQTVRAGVDSIEHGGVPSDENLELMLAKGTFIVSTIGGSWMSADFGHLIGLSDELIAMIREKIADPNRAIGLARAAQAGVPIALGTDQGSPATPPETIITEMFCHLHYKVAPEPMVVIKNATSVAARLCGIDRDVGTIEKGKVADFVVVDGDPLADIEDLRMPKMVFQGGCQVVQDAAVIPERSLYYPRKSRV